MFNPKRVIFKSGTNVDVALIEETQTFEDSCSISKKASNKLTTTVTKVSSIIVNNTDDILGMVKPGTKVEPSTVLFTISDASVSKLTGLDTKTIEALKRLKQFSPKARYRGVVNKFVIYYNSEYDELSDTLKELVDTSNKWLRSNTGDSKITGQVDNSYSIQGKPLQENCVEIKIYIEVVEGMGVADKLIFANQLKSTVGEVFNYTMETEDGTEIDAIFGMKAISNRIVNSPFIMGTTAKVLEVLTDKAIETYFE